MALYLLVADGISIHAPVKGATALKAAMEDAEIISIHAPVKGATYVAGFTDTGQMHYFNPRTREGCDVREIQDFSMKINDFNPRTREGCDRKHRRRLVR